MNKIVYAGPIYAPKKKNLENPEVVLTEKKSKIQAKKKETKQNKRLPIV